jgi:glycosyltransferase involved in cell wall biosynthesis
MRVLLFTRSLDTGGAERQLVLLAKSLHKRGIPVAVMVHYGGGAFGLDLERAGIAIIDLKKTGRWDVFGFAFRTVSAIRMYNPDVVYTFIGAHLVVTVLWALVGRPAIVWGIRASDMDLSYYDWFSRFNEYCSKRFSRFSDAIICNSEAGRTHIIEQGYFTRSITVIPNGIDTVRFRTDVALRQMRGHSWSIPSKSYVIGMMGRIDPMKDHANFLSAAKLVCSQVENVYFICVGSGPEPLQKSLMHHAESLGIADRLLWAGQSDNPTADYAGFDILVSASMTEAFPNVIGESMACGLPVVATDVGDCRQIVGDCGWIVPPKNPEALARAILQALEALPQWPHERSRQRVIEHFSVDAMVDRTLAVFESVVRT